MDPIPSHARAVIIGGGVGGTSIPYHLAELGWTDIVLVERAELTSGSTFHSAGLVGQLRSTVTLTRMMMYGVELYRRLGAETGVDPSWHEGGSLRLASTKERLEELQRQAGWAKTFGLPLELIAAEEAQERFPLMSIEGVLGALFLPTDGWLDPSGLALALAAGARRRGVQIRTRTRVVAIHQSAGQVTGVDVERADALLEHAPHRLPEVRHDAHEGQPSQTGRSRRLLVVRAEQGRIVVCRQLVIDAEIPQVEERIAHARVLPIDDPDALPVVDEVRVEQVVVARTQLDR